MKSTAARVFATHFGQFKDKKILYSRIVNEIQYYAKLYQELRTDYSPAREHLFYNKLLEQNQQYLLIMSAVTLNDPQRENKIRTISAKFDQLHVMLRILDLYESNRFQTLIYGLNDSLRNKTEPECRQVFDRLIIKTLQDAQRLEQTFDGSIADVFTYERMKGVRNSSTNFSKYLLMRIDRWLNQLLDKPSYCTEALRALDASTIVCCNFFSCPSSDLQRRTGTGVKTETAIEALIHSVMDCVVSASGGSRASVDETREAIQYIVELLSDTMPTSRLGILLSRLLGGIDREAVWEKRNALFDVAVRHRLASTIADHIVYRWCLISASRSRQMSGGSLVEAGIWLRRAERLGAGNSPEFRKEATELLRLNSASTGSYSPPPVARQVSSDKSIGEGERGHCNVDRFRLWVDRLQRRFDFIEQVKRFEADPKIDPRPCRMLVPDRAAQHFTKVLPKDRPRVIPAVLDDSFHSGAIALRINIWLAEGCTVAQRDHAIELLKTDTELFASSN